MRNISQLLLVLLSISVIGCVTKRSYSNMNNGLVIKDLIEGEGKQAQDFKTDIKKL